MDEKEIPWLKIQSVILPQTIKKYLLDDEGNFVFNRRLRRGNYTAFTGRKIYDRFCKGFEGSEKEREEAIKDYVKGFSEGYLAFDMSEPYDIVSVALHRSIPEPYFRIDRLIFNDKEEGRIETYSEGKTNGFIYKAFEIILNNPYRYIDLFKQIENELSKKEKTSQQIKIDFNSKISNIGLTIYSGLKMLEEEYRKSKQNILRSNPVEEKRHKPIILTKNYKLKKLYSTQEGKMIQSILFNKSRQNESDLYNLVIATNEIKNELLKEQIIKNLHYELTTLLEGLNYYSECIQAYYSVTRFNLIFNIFYKSYKVLNDRYNLGKDYKIKDGYLVIENYTNKLDNDVVDIIDIDLSDTKGTEKIIMLHELGILEFLKNKDPFNVSTNALASIISGITGVKKETVQSMINPIFSTEVNQKNNPLNSDKTVNKVIAKLNSVGYFKDK